MILECLTIVFVDIEGYTTKTSDQSRGANERLLARFAGVVMPMVRAFNGTVVKGLGDAYLITFRSPTDSLLCAMAVQDQLANRNRHVAEEERFALRFAINVGEVRIDKKDIFGDAVNITARIEALTKPGEIYFSEAVFLMMNKSEIPYEVVGMHALKGLSAEVLIYRVPKLAEVGAYRLALAADSAGDEAEAEPLTLPFGGLALRKVHTRITGQGLARDGSFHLAGAMSEIHYTAGSKARHFRRGPWWRRLLGPAIYLGALSYGLGGLLLSRHTHAGLAARLKATAKQLRDSSEFRQPVLRTALLVALAGGLGYLGWRQHVMTLQAQQQVVAMNEQATRQDLALKVQAAHQAQALKALHQQKLAAAHRASTRQAATQLELTKEKKKFHFPW